MGSSQSSENDGELGWWTISGTNLLALFRRCHAGEDPDHVYMEEYANSEHEYFGDDDASSGGESPNSDS